MLDATEERFTFLGFTVEVKRNPKTGKRFPLIVPSKRAMNDIRKEIKDITRRKNLALPKEAVIAKLNEIVRGWANYFQRLYQSERIP